MARLPPEAARSIRAAVDAIYGRYLARHGKRRWCDKSLDSARLADLLAHLYPDAQFICLYRHCMDVVVSAVEAAPWGLSGYGFDQYVANTPGNMVLAAGRCWLDSTKAIVEFQGKHPERCYGLRYEDLVSHPEEIAGEVFSFLGLAQVPGITDTCFTQEHDIRGPADHKIWFTSQISTRSLGQGKRVPVQMLPPEFLTSLNQTLDQLGYRQVDEGWKTALGPLDPRADLATDAEPDEPGDAASDATAAQIASLLGSVPDELRRDTIRRWPAAADKDLVIAIQSSNGAGPRRCWTLSCTDDALTVCDGQSSDRAAVTVLAAPATWQALLDGRSNVATELRTGKFQLLDAPDRPGSGVQIKPSAELHLIADLLGLTGSIQTTRDFRSANAALPTERLR